MSQKSKIINLYKTLLYLGRDYPEGYDFFRKRLKKAFMKNADVTDPQQIELLIKRGEYVVKELEALYMLRKYRTLKKRYYSEDNDSVLLKKLGEENLMNGAKSFSKEPILKEANTAKWCYVKCVG